MGNTHLLFIRYRDKKSLANTASIDWQYGNVILLLKNENKPLRCLIPFPSFVAKYKCTDVMAKNIKERKEGFHALSVMYTLFSI